MTEAEWLACEEPQAMLEYLKEKVNDRKLRLFAVACCRRVWHFQCEEARCAVLVAEQFADGLASKPELKAAHGSADNVLLAADFKVGATSNQRPKQEAENARRECLAAALAHTTTYPFLEVVHRFGTLQLQAEGQSDLLAQAALVRDIFGNPFRPVVADPAWITDTAMSLARGMYESRDFSALPILADALQDAGCDNPDILNHCRDVSATHVRGCWVVDLVLGKS